MTTDRQPGLSVQFWPAKPTMNLVLFTNTVKGLKGKYLKQSRSVQFEHTPGESWDVLFEILRVGFSGCVYFTCDSRLVVMLVEYDKDKNELQGMLPSDQMSFAAQLRTEYKVDIPLPPTILLVRSPAVMGADLAQQLVKQLGPGESAWFGTRLHVESTAAAAARWQLAASTADSWPGDTGTAPPVWTALLGNERPGITQVRGYCYKT
jgi:hypothetical protein